MSYRLPPWAIAPGLILLSLGAIWVVGKVQMPAGSGEPRLTVAPDASPAPEALSGSDSLVSPTTSPSPEPTPPNFAFPDFTGQTADGKTLHLADLKGKVVLVNYWATWCGPCRMEIPDLIALQKKYGPRGFTVVGLSEDNDFAPAIAFAKENGMLYPVLKTPDNLHEQIPVSGLPTSILLNRSGKVVKVISGIDPTISPSAMWSPAIEKLL